ncbi:TonB-dependent receptor, partial [bacterium]|nr:TonB-dependent receptor [bacterium]
VFLILLSIMQVFASESYSQSTKLTFDFEDITVKDVLVQIEDMSEFYFLYSTKIIDVSREVNISVNNEKISDILDEIFPDDNIEYIVKGRQIVLTSNYLADSFRGIDQQQKTITGTITDENGQALPGVTIIIKGTTQGTVTNTDGNYSISNIPENATLVFSFVGMRTQEIEVGSQTTLNVTMEIDAIGIDEVVTIGYGTARRKDITGAVNTVKMEDSPIAYAPNINALSALKGTSTGLNVGTVNTAGGNPSILIRGQNSISGSNYPLIVLDGVIYLGSISDINPNDIATYDILKDASSTAVYGSRAANGVIIITSKKGKTAKPTIRLNTSMGINVWQQKPQLMSAERYLERKMDRYGVDDPYLADFYQAEKDNYEAGKTVDWMEAGTRIGLNQNYQLSVSGKGERINYYLSSGYIEQEGVIVGDDFKQASLRGKLDMDITDWLEVGVDGSYNYRDNSGLGTDMSMLMTATPYGDLYWDEENKLLEKFPSGESRVNPLWDTDKTIVEDSNHENYYRIYGYAYIKIPFVKGLSYRLNYVRGNKINNTDRFYHEGYFVAEGYGTVDPIDRYGNEALQNKLGAARGSSGRRNSYNYVVDNIINYKRQFKDHYFDATLVATRDYSNSKYIQIDGNDFAANGNTELGFNGLHKADVQSYNITLVEESNIGYLGRLSYSFKDKYHLSATYRRDGSSVFGADKKWGDFPSVGIAWTVTQEKFLKSKSFIDYLKIRASYGKNGNQGINAYQTLTTITSGRNSGIRYEFSDNPSKILYGMAISTLGNPDLGWETTTSFNGGFESVLMDNRIFLDVDFYFSKTNDQLFVRQIPIMTGFSSIRSSMGQVNNRGIELSLTTINIKNQDLTWKSNLTFWQNRNILDELYGDDIDGDGVEDDDIGNSLFIGKSLGAIYGYEFDGIIQEDDTEYMNNNGGSPGDVKFKDISGPEGVPDGLITSTNDRKIIGYLKENFTLNFANTLNYKKLEFYVLISGIFGGGKENYYAKPNSYAYRMQQQPGLNNLEHPWWTPENKNNSYPSTNYFDNRFVGIQSRTFIRIQDVTLSYQFDQTWVKKLNIESLKVYSSIQNLYTFTDWVGGDAEQGVSAMSGTYPVPSIYSIGLNISF